MIALATLSFIINRRKKDAIVLFAAGQYASCVYMMGYAVEVALKKRICHTLAFNAGFPATAEEFGLYRYRLVNGCSAPRLQSTLQNIRQIRNHDLSLLLWYTGMEPHIRKKYALYWNRIAHWHPGQRYLRLMNRKETAEEYVEAAIFIIEHLSNFDPWQK